MHFTLLNIFPKLVLYLLLLLDKALHLLCTKLPSFLLSLHCLTLVCSMQKDNGNKLITIQSSFVMWNVEENEIATWEILKADDLSPFPLSYIITLLHTCGDWVSRHTIDSNKLHHSPGPFSGSTSAFGTLPGCLIHYHSVWFYQIAMISQSNVSL